MKQIEEVSWKLPPCEISCPHFREISPPAKITTFTVIHTFVCHFPAGVVSINSRIDYESVEFTSFKASVWDSGTPRLNNSATVYVTILNVNDNSPVFTQVKLSKFLLGSW